MARKIINIIIKIVCIIFILIVAVLAWKEYIDTKNKNTFYDKISTGEPINILINGDSIGGGTDSSDWCMLLSEMLNNTYPSYTNVTNISMGGNSTYAGYCRINKTALASTDSYDLIVFCYGQNDVDNDEFPMLYESMIISAIKNYPNAQLVAVLESSQREYTNKINEIIELCDYYNIPYIDTIKAFNESGYEYSELSNDGIHPNKKGNEIYAETIFDKLQAILNDKKHTNKYPKNPINANCSDYKYFYYIALDKMDEEEGLRYIDVLEDYSTLGIDRDLKDGNYDVDINIAGTSYDISYQWDYGFSQRHIERIKKDGVSAGRIELPDDYSVGNVYGLIITNNKEIESLNNYHGNISLDTAVENIDSETIYNSTILNTNAELHKATGGNDEARNYSTYVYAVEEGQQLLISSNTIGTVGTITRYAFFADESGKECVKKGAYNIGGWKDGYTSGVEVPKGAAYLFITSQNGSAPSVVKKEMSNDEKTEQLRIMDVKSSWSINSTGTIVDSANYSIYIYDLSGVNEIIVSSNTIGNTNSIMRYAFFGDMDGANLIRKGTLNAGGWSDSYDKDIFISQEESYLYVVSQNGTYPNVTAKW
jgi:lysophospholipase L1-like esterase